MSRRKKEKVIYAEHDGVLYVKLHVVMHPITMLIDGIPFTQFGGDETPYMTVEQAIEWSDREATLSSKPNQYRIQAANLRRALEQFKAGEGIVAGKL